MTSQQIERIHQQKECKARKIAAHLQALYPNCKITYGYDDQRRGPAIMRVRLFHETETECLGALVAVYGSEYYAQVVAHTLKPATDELTQVIGVSRDHIGLDQFLFEFLDGSLAAGFKAITAKTA